MTTPIPYTVDNRKAIIAENGPCIKFGKLALISPNFLEMPLTDVPSFQEKRDV